MRLKMEPFALVALLGSICAMNVPIATGESQVFRCTVEGIVTFSDRPCGTDAEIYEPDEAHLSAFAAPPESARAAPATKRRRARSKEPAVSIAAAQAKHAEKCAQLDRSLRDVRSKMRAGYDAKQGERLKERQRKLSAQRRDQRCS